MAKWKAERAEEAERAARRQAEWEAGRPAREARKRELARQRELDRQEAEIRRQNWQNAIDAVVQGVQEYKPGEHRKGSPRLPVERRGAIRVLSNPNTALTAKSTAVLAAVPHAAIDEKYLYSAVRQVECNPVKAHLVSFPSSGNGPVHGHIYRVKTMILLM